MKIRKWGDLRIFLFIGFKEPNIKPTPKAKIYSLGIIRENASFIKTLKIIDISLNFKSFYKVVVKTRLRRLAFRVNDSNIL